MKEYLLFKRYRYSMISYIYQPRICNMQKIYHLLFHHFQSLSIPSFRSQYGYCSSSCNCPYGHYILHLWPLYQSHTGILSKPSLGFFFFPFLVLLLFLCEFLEVLHDFSYGVSQFQVKMKSFAYLSMNQLSFMVNVVQKFILLFC